MAIRQTALLGAALILGVGACTDLTPSGSGPNPGFTQLFDGRTLGGWSIAGAAKWVVRNGEIQPDIAAGGNPGFLVSNRRYADFRLQLEFRPDAIVNSGVFIRVQDATNINPEDAYEVNIWDNHVNQDFRTGAIVRRAFPPLAKVTTIDRWNSYDIIARGNSITASVNSIKTAEYVAPDDFLKSGYIALQWAGKGLIKFRNIRLQKL